MIGQELLRRAGRRPRGVASDSLAGGGAAREAVRRQSVAGEPGSPEGVKPIYVRSPDADIHITKMRDPWAETTEGR